MFSVCVSHVHIYLYACDLYALLQTCLSVMTRPHVSVYVFLYVHAPLCVIVFLWLWLCVSVCVWVSHVSFPTPLRRANIIKWPFPLSLLCVWQMIRVFNTSRPGQVLQRKRLLNLTHFKPDWSNEITATYHADAWKLQNKWRIFSFQSHKRVSITEKWNQIRLLKHIRHIHRHHTQYKTNKSQLTCAPFPTSPTCTVSAVSQTAPVDPHIVSWPSFSVLTLHLHLSLRRSVGGLTSCGCTLKNLIRTRTLPGCKEPRWMPSQPQV